MRSQTSGSFGRSHYLGLCRGLMFLILLMIPLAICAAPRSMHHAFHNNTAPWLAR